MDPLALLIALLLEWNAANKGYTFSLYKNSYLLNLPHHFLFRETGLSGKRKKSSKSHFVALEIVTTQQVPTKIKLCNKQAVDIKSRTQSNNNYFKPKLLNIGILGILLAFSRHVTIFFQLEISNSSLSQI